MAKPVVMTGEDSSTFSFFLPLAKVDKKKRIVSGYASTPSLDLDGEIVTLDAVKAALPGYWAWRNVREMHRPSAIGVAQEANVDEMGLFLSSKIVDDEAWKKVEEGVYKGYSIGGRKLAKSGNKITEIELIEVSLVDRPANPDCRIEIAKMAKGGSQILEGALAHLVPIKNKDPKDKALRKMAEAVVEAIAKGGPPAAHDGFSLPAKPTLRVVEKREYSEDQRKEYARQGIALPDGSYPIPDKDALKDAIDAYGRAKDKPEAKAHILSRAKALSAEDMIPKKWAKKAKKLAKRLARQAEAKCRAQEQQALKAAAKFDLSKTPSSLAQPAFLTLGAEGAGPLHASASPRPTFLPGLDPKKAGTDVWSPKQIAKFRKHLDNRLEPKAHRVDVLDLKKSMSTVTMLSSAFDMIRGAQRCLIMEGQREKDLKDKGLAKQLGDVAKSLAEVIGQKAEHEGGEALDLSDADDTWLISTLGEDFVMDANITDLGKGLGEAISDDQLGTVILELIKRRGATVTKAGRIKMASDNIRKARKMRKGAMQAIEEAHAMHKAAYLSKAAKKDKGKGDDDGDFDHEEAMSKLQKAYSDLNSMKTFLKAADTQLEKAAHVGERGQEAGDSQAGVYEVPAGVTDLSQTILANAPPGKVAKGIEKLVKNGMVPVELIEVLQKNAALEARVDVLDRVAASGSRRPHAFDMTKLAGGESFGKGADKNATAKLFNGVDVAAIGSGDERAHTEATAKMIGNMLMGGDFAKSILDPGFHGAAGVKA